MGSCIRIQGGLKVMDFLLREWQVYFLVWHCNRASAQQFGAGKEMERVLEEESLG